MIDENLLSTMYREAEEKYYRAFKRKFRGVPHNIVTNIPWDAEYEILVKDKNIYRAISYKKTSSPTRLIEGIIHEEAHIEFSFCLPSELAYKFALAATQEHRKQPITALEYSKFIELTQHSEVFARAVTRRARVTDSHDKKNLMLMINVGDMGLLYDCYLLAPLEDFFDFPSRTPDDIILQTIRKYEITENYLSVLKNIEKLLIESWSIFQPNVIIEFRKNRQRLKKGILNLLKRCGRDLSWLEENYPEVSNFLRTQS
ncbi:MAG: hypothetical protein QMD12_02420 [Candidatus Aenigmarchaeota archaeon]|nr:hypothetical protein [Candidatus Aenigmarchaeota archaeon]